VFTHTDARGLTTTNTWDNLNRLTSTAFPDGTAISYTYTNLDLIRVVDRMGFTNSFGYDNMRHKVAETNALGNPTLYNYCTCGSLNSILDAGNNLTQFSYDNQGNLTYTLYADNYSVTRTLNLLKQVVSTTDSSGYSVTNTYNNQGLIISVSNAFGRVQSTVYDALDRATNAVDANGVSINKTYDNLNRPLTRSYPDNGVEKWGYTLNVFGATSYTNQIGNAVLYGFDAMNRKTNEVYVGVTTNQFAYNGAGDLLTLTDGKNQPTTWGYDSYGRVSGVEVVGGAIVGTVSGVAAGVVVGITTENPYAGGTAGVIVGGLAGGRDIYGGSRMLGEGHERAKQILDTYNRCMAKCE
jgi:YD repeat-containing protein